MSKGKSPLSDRLWAKIEKDKPNKCWLWLAYTNPCGYGVLSAGKKRGTNILAHRAAYLDAVGRIPVGLHVLHRCDNPPCCNPAHLFLGTHSDNHRDKAAKGRAPRGEKSGVAKLSEKQIIAIRTAEGTHKNIAACYGVVPQTVSKIKRRERWAHL